MKFRKKIFFSSLISIFLFCNYAAAGEVFAEEPSISQGGNCAGIDYSSSENASYLPKNDIAFIGMVNLGTIMTGSVTPEIQKEWHDLGAGCVIGKLQSKNIPSDYNLVYREERGYSIEFGGDFNNSIAMIYSEGKKNSTKDRYYCLIRLSEKEGKLLAAYSKLPPLEQAKADLEKAMQNKFKPMMSAKINEQTKQLELKFK